MKLTEILNESILKEIGDLNKIEPYKFSVNGPYTTFFTDQDDRVNVDFTGIYGKSKDRIKLPPIVAGREMIFNIGFDISGTDSQYRKSNFKYLIRILKTVVEICKIVIKKENANAKSWKKEPPVFIFGARDKLGRDFIADSQKSRLYKLILDKNLPKSYRIGNVTIDGIKGLYFTEK